MNRTFSPGCALAALTQVLLSTSLLTPCPVAECISTRRRVFDCVEHGRWEDGGSRRVVEGVEGRR